MPGAFSFHHASVAIGTFASKLPARYEGDHTRRPPRRSDRRWPKRCACGYKFTATDTWQLAVDRAYEYDGPFGHWLVTTKNAPPGSLWDARWLPRTSAWCGPDKRSLEVICPNGHPWHIDGRASNCTLKDDNVHKCWVRHGDPTKPTGPEPLHVDKNGRTCSAGAGSIIAGNYHGFLHRGHFTPG